MEFIGALLSYYVQRHITWQLAPHFSIIPFLPSQLSAYVWKLWMWRLKLRTDCDCRKMGLSYEVREVTVNIF